MARGNQRDKAREKNEKAKASEGKKMTGNVQQRNEANAAALAAKIAEKKAKADGTFVEPPKPKTFLKK